MEIQFGEVQHSQPDEALRPDEDPRLAVAVVGAVETDELPIFVDLDVMREMEAHARTNTNVELGGVMLGRQVHDSRGQPFVLVTDCLRAEHYEATKGSFKFTHETWQKIARQRDAYPEDVQMVGWYHTHPDWGVFLSGMDLFICNNFFNRPLDIALVIDPCRDDRGWFQWHNFKPEETRQTSGFYLMASRFREQELQHFVNLYNGNPQMADARYNPMFGGGGQPVVNIHDGRTPVQNIAIMAMLTIQMLVLCLIAWRMLGPNPGTETQLANINAQVEQLASDRMQAARNEAYRETLAMALEPDRQKLAEELVQSRLENERRLLEHEGQLALGLERKKLIQKINQDLAKEKKESADRQFKLKELQARYDQLEQGKTAPWPMWMIVAGGVVLGAVGVAGGFAASRFAQGAEFDLDHSGASAQPAERLEPAEDNSKERSAGEAESPVMDEGIEFEKDRD